MPRYYFHIRDGLYLPDAEGTELEDAAAAKQQAVAVSSEAIHDLGERFWSGHLWQMEVVDDQGREVLTLHFRGNLIQRV